MPGSLLSTPPAQGRRTFWEHLPLACGRSYMGSRLPQGSVGQPAPAPAGLSAWNSWSSFCIPPLPGWVCIRQKLSVDGVGMIMGCSHWSRAQERCPDSARHTVVSVAKRLPPQIREMKSCQLAQGWLPGWDPDAGLDMELFAEQWGQTMPNLQR